MRAGLGIGYLSFFLPSRPGLSILNAGPDSGFLRQSGLGLKDFFLLFLFLFFFPWGECEIKRVLPGLSKFLKKIFNKVQQVQFSRDCQSRY